MKYKVLFSINLQIHNTTGIFT